MSDNNEKNYKVEPNKDKKEYHTHDDFSDNLGKSYSHMGEHIRKHFLKYAMISVVAAALIVFGGVSAAAAANVAPYAVNVSGKTVCYVNGKNSADEVVKELLAAYVPEGAAIKAVSSEDEVVSAVSASEISEARDNTVSVKAAVKSAKKALAAEDVSTAITVVSTGTETKKFTPKTKYIKDDTMLAGDAVVEVEAEKGKKEYTMRYTTVNGEVTDKEVLDVTVLKKGTAAKIRKGTLGLPEGADWRTYEGDPVYENGEDLTMTALNYLGVPYKYGGTSLINGIDCVQFIRQMYAKYGISLPNGKNALKHVGVAVSYENARPGDIICYSNHYALYLGNGKIVHAIRRGVSVSNNARYRPIVTIRRIVG